MLYLSQEQMEPVDYGFWPRKMSGSALEANRFARDCNVAHHRAFATEASARTRTALSTVTGRPEGVPGRSPESRSNGSGGPVHPAAADVQR